MTYEQFEKAKKCKDLIEFQNGYKDILTKRFPFSMQDKEDSFLLYRDLINEFNEKVEKRHKEIIGEIEDTFNSL